MDAEIRYRMTAELMGRTAKRSVRRQLLLLMLILVPTILGLFLAIPILCATSDVKWDDILILVGVIVVVLTFVVIRVPRKVLRAIREASQRQGEYEVVMRVTDEGVHFSSPFVTGMYPWRVFERFVEREGLGFLHVNRATCFLFPRDVLTAEVREFIVHKVLANGGRVKGGPVRAGAS